VQSEQSPLDVRSSGFRALNEATRRLLRWNNAIAVQDSPGWCGESVGRTKSQRKARLRWRKNWRRVVHARTKRIGVSIAAGKSGVRRAANFRNVGRGRQLRLHEVPRFVEGRGAKGFRPGEWAIAFVREKSAGALPWPTNIWEYDFERGVLKRVSGIRAAIRSAACGDLIRQCRQDGFAQNGGLEFGLSCDY